VTLPRRLPVSTLPPATELWRIHSRAHDPVWFGPDAGVPPRNRFDAPAGEFRVCYFGEAFEAALVETLVRGRARLIVALTEPRSRSATSVPLDREIRVARLHSDGLVRLSLSTATPHAESYDVCQQLALSLWAHPDEIDGIEYRSRWDDSLLCVALFDRAADALAGPSPPLGLDSTSLVRPVLRRYGIGVD